MPRAPGPASHALGEGDPFAAARTAMLENQLRARGVRDPRVLAAMASVPREAFVPRYLHDRAYADEALPIDQDQTISQPLMVGLMTQLLAPEPGQQVLDIGTGSGYQAAVLAAMGCRVTSVERLPDLAEDARRRLAGLDFADVGRGDLSGSAGGRGDLAGSGDEPSRDASGSVEILVGDGSNGVPGGAPWPRILVAAAAPSVPAALTDQLADGGRLVIPVGRRWEQELLLVERDGDRLRTTHHGACVFVPLVGAGGFR